MKYCSPHLQLIIKKDFNLTNESMLISIGTIFPLNVSLSLAITTGNQKNTKITTAKTR